MTMISIVQAASRDAYSALLAGIEEQYGRTGSVEIAGRFLEAELADYHWESRIEERWLGGYEGSGDDGESLERIGIIGRLKGVWFVAVSIVDGDGAVHWMHDLRLMKDAWDADEAFVQLT